MNRDHLLGFPPVLLAIDPELAQTPGLTPARPRLTLVEQQARRELDLAETAKLSPAGSTQETDGFTYYDRQGVAFRWYRHDGYSGRPEVWNSETRAWQRSRFTMDYLLNPELRSRMVVLEEKPAETT